MSAPHRSTIGWTDYSGGDANIVTGCTPVSVGCRNCYARAIYERFGRDFGAVHHYSTKLGMLKGWYPRGPWKRERPMVFVCDTGDLFHERVAEEFIDKALSVFWARPDIDWQILTKRPARMLDVVRAALDRRITPKTLPSNIWLGVTVEDQATADERIPLLLQVPAVVRWVSVEPCLEEIDLRHLHYREDITEIDALAGTHGLYRPHQGACAHLDWVVVGAESGPNRRPFDVAWAVGLYEQCQEAGVAYYFKQGSALRPGKLGELPGIGEVKEWPNAVQGP